MGFGEAIQSVFSKYATFDGRARRSEYWYFTLFQVLVSVVLIALSATGLLIFSAIQLAFILATLIPNLAVFWRRMHDIGRSGAYYFFNLIPFVGLIILLVWECQDSQPGANQYGPNPKGM